MRTSSPKLKHEEITPIPARLVGFLRDVSERIEARDEATMIESDDLLQTDFAYGGRDSEDDDRYSFTYFPEPGVRQKWEFSLTTADLAAIAQAEHPTLRLWACTQPGCRSKFESAEGPQCFYCDWNGPSAAG